MKKNKTILVSVIALLLITGMAACKKENSDLTTGIVGRYKDNTRTAWGMGNYFITINKVDDKTISLNEEGNLLLNNVKMNTATTFIINEIHQQTSYSDTIIGSGTYSSNNISYQYRKTSSSTSFIDIATISATKLP